MSHVQVISHHPALLLIGSVGLVKLLNHSVPPSYLQNGNDNSTYIARLL